MTAEPASSRQQSRPPSARTAQPSTDVGAGPGPGLSWIPPIPNEAPVTSRYAPDGTARSGKAHQAKEPSARKPNPPRKRSNDSLAATKLPLLKETTSPFARSPTSSTDPLPIRTKSVNAAAAHGPPVPQHSSDPSAPKA